VVYINHIIPHVVYVNTYLSNTGEKEWEKDFAENRTMTIIRERRVGMEKQTAIAKIDQRIHQLFTANPKKHP
jgi:hypothetical protein